MHAGKMIIMQLVQGLVGLCQFCDEPKLQDYYWICRKLFSVVGCLITDLKYKEKLENWPVKMVLFLGGL